MVLGKATIYSRDNLGLATVSEIADKILETFSDLQDMQMSQEREKDKAIKEIISETKRNMMIVLIIGFLGTIVLGLLFLEKLHFHLRRLMMLFVSFRIVTLTFQFITNNKMKLVKLLER